MGGPGAKPLKQTRYIARRDGALRSGMHLRTFSALVLLGLGTSGFAADNHAPTVVPPTVAPPAIPKAVSAAPGQVAKDGLPTGQDSAEGVACDLARSFAAADATMWSGITIKLPSDDKAHAKLESFVEATATEMEAEAKKPDAERSGPKDIGACFKARHLSDANAVTYGSSLYHYQDVMFVDVVVKQHDGQETANRTLVVKAADGKWYVHPQPSLSPMLSMGLNSESDSEEEVQRKPGAAAHVPSP